MEHYDWNDGWLFTPVFDPAIVRPECPELTLEPVRLPHTVKALPYNYCNENDYQKLSGYRRALQNTVASWATAPKVSRTVRPSHSLGAKNSRR